MAYSRVLGTIGLLGATVLGATGPLHAPITAQAAAPHRITLTSKVSTAGAIAAEKLALRQGFFTGRNGKKIQLSSVLNSRWKGVGGASSSGSVSAGHANSSPPPQITHAGGVRANQDFGFYTTGNLSLIHI